MGGLRIYPDRRDLLVEGLNAMFRLTPYQDFMRQEWDRLALRGLLAPRVLLAPRGPLDRLDRARR